MEQGSDEWFEARRGKLTASRLHRLMSGKAQTKQRLLDVMRREIAAGPGGWIESRSLDTPAINWGRDNEPKALKLYSQHFGRPVRAVGVLFHPELDYVGASPDGMIDGGSLEVKCPYNPQRHEDTLNLGMPKRHRCQVQAQSFVTGLPFVDFISFHPQFEKSQRLFVQRIPADPDYHRELRRRCEWFWNALLSGGALL